MSMELSKPKKVDRDQDIKSVQSVVSDHIPHLTAAALAAALGGTMVLKLKVSDTGKMKYLPCTTSEEIIQALEWIADFGNDIHGESGGYAIIQQRPPDAKFWDALTNRHLGKIPEEQKLSISHKLDLADVGRKAINHNTKPKNEAQLYIPSSWEYTISNEKNNNSNE